jgi:hypothetical protein
MSEQVPEWEHCLHLLYPGDRKPMSYPHHDFLSALTDCDFYGGGELHARAWVESIRMKGEAV